MQHSFAARLSRHPLLLVGLISLAVFVGAHLTAFTNFYVINDDVRQQIYWMAQFQDPELFPDDLLTDYARRYVPFGVKGLYWLASFLVSPLWFCKILPGLLFIWLGCLLYRMGEGLDGPPLGWTMAAVVWLVPLFLENLSGGLARSFAPPLLAWFWLGWLRRSPGTMGLALLAQSLFIPYIFPVAAGAVLLAWGWGWLRGGELPPFPRRLGHFLILASAAVLVFAFNRSLTQSGFGPLVSAAEMMGRPEFTAAGRYAFLPVASLPWEFLTPLASLAPFRELGKVGGSVVLVALLVWAGWGARRLNRRQCASRLSSLAFLLASSLMFYFLARLFFLKLFVPDRYLQHLLPLSYTVLLSWSWQAPFRGRRRVRYLPVLLIGLAATLGVMRLHGAGLYDFSPYRSLYAALEQTPKSALIAGHPNLMDNAVTFGQRRAFATFELAHPWSKGYWERLAPRLRELFAAYYAHDPRTVREFCRRHRIDFLVLDRRHFEPAFLAGGAFLAPFDDLKPVRDTPRLREKVTCPFFAPFDAEIRRTVQAGLPFALLSPEHFPGRDLDRHLRLIDMRPQPGSRGD